MEKIENTTPRISVVIITYKRPINILERAIRSVLSQTFEDIELLVVNDAPEEVNLTQEIKKMILNLNDSRIKYLSYPQNGGSNFARNHGLKNSKGKYICFLDDDDEWYRDKLQRQYECIIEDNDIALVSCEFDVFKDGNEYKKKNCFPDYDLDISYLLKDNYIGGTSFPMLRREYVLEAGGFDDKLPSCQEYDLWIRLRKKYKFVSVPISLGKYYISSDSIYKKSQKRYYDGDCMVLQKYRELFEKHPRELNYHLNRMAFNFMQSKDYKYFFKYKLKALSVKPFCLMNFYIIYRIKEKLTRR